MLIFGIIVGLVVGEVAMCALWAIFEFHIEKRTWKKKYGAIEEKQKLIKSEDDELWGF